MKEDGSPDPTGEGEGPPTERRFNELVKTALVFSVFAAVFLLVVSTLTATILRIQHTSSTSAFSNISNAALDLIPGVAFLHSMQVYEQEGETQTWAIRLAALSMDSSEDPATEYRTEIHDDLTAAAPTRSSSSSSSSSRGMDRGTCERSDRRRRRRNHTPWNAKDELLAALAALFQQQMVRRVERRSAAAAAAAAVAAAAAAEGASGVAAAAANPANTAANDELPRLEVNKFRIKANQQIPLPATFSWLFKFKDSQYCLLMNTLYSAFSDEKNSATLFLTSSERDFYSLAGLLKENKLLLDG